MSNFGETRLDQRQVLPTGGFRPVVLTQDILHLVFEKGSVERETSDRREGLAARKTLFFMEKAQQSCPFLHSGTNGQNLKNINPSS